MRVFNALIISVAFLLLFEVCFLVETKECYTCGQCPEPFNIYEASTERVDKNDYCYKRRVINGNLTYIHRGGGGRTCTPLANFYYCCKGNLCNGNVPTSIASSIVLVVTLISLFLYRSFVFYN